jgi:TonB family protein
MIRPLLMVGLLLVAPHVASAQIQVSESLPPIPRGAVEEVPPVLINPDVVRASTLLEYPRVMRATDEGGTAVIGFVIDRHGRPTRLAVTRSSGNVVLDSAALRVVGVMRYRPAQVNRRNVELLIDFPLTFAPTTRPADGAPAPADAHR